MTPLIIFGLLILLMLTGMPISIALGLTVLTFIYVMTNVPTESVALKLFTGIDNFEIMAIPFFILAGNFLTHGGVARRMINFATSMVGHWYGGLGLAGVMACALFTVVVGTMGAKFVWGLYHTDQVTPDLELPSWIIYLCVPLGSYLMCFRFLQVAVKFWQSGELPHHDETDVDGLDPELAAAEAARIVK